jgi:hypothetical protein
MDLDLGGVTFHGGGVSKPPLDRVWLCRLERWQVYLTAGRFYAKLDDASR